jgi:uncharacterized protein (TIGR03000 family)
MRRLCGGFVALAALVGAACGQDKKTATVTITVPEAGYKETVVTVNGAEVKGAGGTRTYTTGPLDAGKELKLKVEALIEPNNYTKITRPREVTVKAGDAAKLDLTTEDKKLDKIVVRWVPTPNDIVDEMAKLARIGKDDVVFDPGCGTRSCSSAR